MQLLPNNLNALRSPQPLHSPDIHSPQVGNFAKIFLPSFPPPSLPHLVSVTSIPRCCPCCRRYSLTGTVFTSFTAHATRCQHSSLPIPLCALSPLSKRLCFEGIVIWSWYPLFRDNRSGRTRWTPRSDSYMVWPSIHCVVCLTDTMTLFFLCADSGFLTDGCGRLRL